MATLTSISLVINPSTVSINDTASFYVLANYSDGTSGPVTVNFTFTLGTEGITAIPSLELWIGNESWGNDNEKWGDKDY